MSGVITTNRGFPTAPPEAKAVGFTRLILFDDFEINKVTIDSGNTLATGFNWYISPTDSWVYAGTTSVASSVVTTNQILNGSKDLGRISSIGMTNISTGSYVGWLLNASQGFYIEAAMAFDPTLATGFHTPGPAWPAFWLTDVTHNTTPVPIAGLIGTEIDVVECIPQSAGVSQIWMNDFILQMQANGTDTVVAQGSGQFPGSLTYTNQNKYAALLMPMALNGGNGYLKRYANDVNYPTLTTTWTAGSTFAPLEQKQYIVILDCGFQWPVRCHWIAIWGKA